MSRIQGSLSVSLIGSEISVLDAKREKSSFANDDDLEEQLGRQGRWHGEVASRRGRDFLARWHT